MTLFNRMKLRLGRDASVSPKRPTAFTAAKNRISSGLSVTMLFIADSTGYGVDAPIYRFALWLATAYPTHTVRFREWAEWSTGIKDYGAPADLSEGSTGAVIDIYSATLPGSTAATMTDGSRVGAAITGIPTPDVIVWDHGHNMTSNQWDYTGRGDFLGPIGTVQMAWPNAPMAAIVQNPWRDGGVYDAKVRPNLIRAAATLGNVTLIDGWTPFIKRGKAAGLYLAGPDGNIHPGPDGYALILAAIVDCWVGTLTGGVFPVSAWPKRMDVRNFLPGGNLGDPSWTAGTPTGWSLTSGCTVTRETTITFDGAPQSAALQGANAASNFDNFFGTANTNIARGRNLTMAILAYVPSAGDRAFLATFGATGSGAPNTGALQRAYDTWAWYVISDVPVLPTQASGGLYCRISPQFNQANPKPFPSYVQRVLMVEGGLPKGLVP